MRIAILGFGTVGSGAYEIAKAAKDIEVVRILARHGREGYEDLSGIITADIEDITTDETIDLVVESIGGIEPAHEYVLACLNAGKHVVTPNKNLISAYYGELMAAAKANNVELRFTATAGGGIPWLANLLRTRRCDTIKAVRGIVNGTCNYILDAMYDSGASFDVMLKKAQELGYAEANPAADIEGTDSLRKTVISTNLAFGVEAKEEDIPCYGIDTIDACDIEWMKEHGYSVRLMMNAKEKDGKVSAFVEPTLFPIKSLEANVKVNNNMITLTGESIGTQSFYGQGAGALPTGESVIQDVIDIQTGAGVSPAEFGVSGAVVDNSGEIKKYYIRTDKMSEHMTERIESYEEKDGIYYCISKPMPLAHVHELGHHKKEKGVPLFFAAMPQED